MNKSYKIFCSQVSGKEPKLLSEDQTIVLKGYNHHEQRFYNFISTLTINHLANSLQKFLPKFQGILSIDDIPIIHHNENVKDQNTIEWLQHLKKRYETRNPENKFIMLENIIHSYKRPNVIDIKLGVRSPHKVKSNKKDKNELFKLNGCRINVKHFQEQKDNNEYETLFFSKYFFKTLITEQEIIQHLALYFFSGQILRLELLQKTIQKLRQLILALKCLKGWRFYSTSLCVFYDAQNTNKFDVKLLDFGRSTHTGQERVDQSTIDGLQNLHRFLLQIKNNNKKIEQKLLHMKNKYLKQAILIVPEKKIVQYQGSSRQVSANSSPKKNYTCQQ